MKIPAIRSQIGDWTYYITTLTFEQVADNVSPIDDNLHKSESLKDLIQRSITDNYKSIMEYILNQKELFFNSLVLAVYDEYPNWIEIEVKYDDFESYQIGLLDFPGKHKIFPVDGQHRVEGIKASLKEDNGLKNNRISAIFIGHKNDKEGIKRTRRLFTTLNRYAKPVSLDDIIALDEDDTVAITTRELLENHELFTGKRVIYAKQKAIPTTNKWAFTSIITLYQANLEIFKVYYEETFGKKPTTKNIKRYLKFRPQQMEINNYYKYMTGYWNSFKDSFDSIKKYVSKSEDPVGNYRNPDSGGNLLFRPVGLLPFVKASLRIHTAHKINYSKIFKKYNTLELNINQRPWENVVWSSIENKMIMNTSKLTELLLIYLFDKELLTTKETGNLREGYAARLGLEDPKQALRYIR